MQFRINIFGGTKPKIAPQLLGASSAQVASNCDLQFGDLRPVAGLSPVSTISKPGAHRSLFRIGTQWVAWPALVDLVFSPTYNKDRRFIFTGAGEPQKSSAALATSGADSGFPTTTYGLGVPAPALPLTVTLAPAASTADTLRSTSYVYTYITGWGEESAPSDATGVFEVKDDQTTTLTTNTIPPTGYNITAWRIYRVTVGTSSKGDFQFVAECTISDTTYSDTKKDSELGAVIATTAYTAPISPWSGTAFYLESQRTVYGGIVYRCKKDIEIVGTTPNLDVDHWEVSNSLSGVASLSNGVIAAFVENELCMTPPYIPYGWPLAYNLTAEYPIVALGHYSNTLVILTEGWPYLSDGIDPSAAGLTKIDSMQPCINKRGVVSGTDFVLYPSPDGLVMIGSSGLTVVTSGVVTKKQWAALSPESFVAFWYDGKYIAFVEGTSKGYVLDAKSESPSLLEINFPAGTRIWGGYVDLTSDGLYLLTDHSDGIYKVEQYDAGSYLPYTWKSKQISVPQYTAIAAVRVRGAWENGVTFTFFGDSIQVYQCVVSNNKPFRLPTGKWRTLEFSVSGTDRLEEVGFATSLEELMRLTGDAEEVLS